MHAATHQEEHKSVLLDEAVDMLAPRDGGVYCDATVGLGGHTRAVLERCGPTGRVVGIDRDAEALAVAREALEPFGSRVALVHAPFSQLPHVLKTAAAWPVDGCLADLGVSSRQLDQPERGFSFQSNGPLDMRMDRSSGATAAKLIAELDEENLADILYELGEERHSRRIARAICAARQEGPIETTAALASLIARVVPRRERKNPATRSFQALRIAVNRELDELDEFLTVAPTALRPGGRLVVIAFHSLEDRMVKRRFRTLAANVHSPNPPHAPAQRPPEFRLVVRKAIKPSERECDVNPRARSARLRVLERVAA